MTDIAASIGIVQLEKLDSINKKRINNANYFNKNIENNEEIILPFTEKNTNHVFHQYTMRVLNGKRDLLKDSLENKGIQSRIFYPLPINQQPLYEELGYSKNTPISEIASNEVLCLPVHPKLSNLDLEKIVESVNGVIKKW
jgi:perosamine synthetase